AKPDSLTGIADDERSASSGRLEKDTAGIDAMWFATYLDRPAVLGRPDRNPSGALSAPDPDVAAAPLVRVDEGDGFAGFSVAELEACAGGQRKCADDHRARSVPHGELRAACFVCVQAEHGAACANDLELLGPDDVR